MSTPITILPRPQKLSWLNEQPLMVGEIGRPAYRIRLDGDSTIPVVARTLADLKTCLEGLLGQAVGDEAAQYQCLCQDFIALLDMMDEAGKLQTGQRNSPRKSDLISWTTHTLPAAC